MERYQQEEDGGTNHQDSPVWIPVNSPQLYIDFGLQMNTIVYYIQYCSSESIIGHDQIIPVKITNFVLSVCFTLTVAALGVP